jgi:WD40 repeat protein
MRTPPPLPNETILDPYIGLRPYTDSDDDRARFFGREQDQEIIIANLYAARLTVFYGASGVGKSSVLLAGVVPKLRETSRFACVVFRTWQLENVLPSLKTAILNAVQNAAKQAVEVDLAMSLDDFLLECTHVMRGHIVLIFDQFEEYFLYPTASGVSEGFEAEFARSVNRTEIDASFLLSMREDWLSKLDRFQGRIPKLLNNLLRLDHLDRDAAIRAIREPLEACNKRLPPGEPPASIDEDLVEALLDQLKPGSVTLDHLARPVDTIAPATAMNNQMWIETPFLQVVLTRLWDQEKKHGSRRLRLATLNKLGGASRILNTHLDKTMGKLKRRQRRIAVDIFGYLVTPSGGKIAHTAADLASYSRRREKRLVPLLERLADSSIRVLRVIPPPPGERDGVRYEIFHDVLAAAILTWRRRKLVWRRVWRAIRWAFAIGALPILLALLILAHFLLLWLFPSYKQGFMQGFEESTERADSLASLPVIADLNKAVPNFQAVMRGHMGPVYRVACSPNGTHIATASGDQTARVWETATGKFLFKLQGHTPDVGAVVFSPNGKLATSRADNTACLWNAETGQLKHELKGHKKPLTMIAFSPDGRFVVTASQDSTARVWDADTGQSLAVLEGHTKSVNSAFFSPGSDRVITASTDGTARIWDATTGKSLTELTDHTTPVFKAMFSRDGNLALTVSHRTVRVWDAATGTLIKPLSGHKDIVTDGVFSPDSRFVATASADGTACIWDARSGKLAADPLSGHTGPVWCVRFSPDGARLVTASDDNTARVWDATSGKIEAVLRGHTGDVTSAEFTLPDGKFVMTGSRDGTVRVWAPSTARSLFALGHDAEIYSAKWSSDSRLIVTASRDGSARVWDSNGNLVSKLVGHSREVMSAEFSPDNSSIVTASRDNTGALWDPRTGHQIALLDGHADWVSSASFSLDGNFIVTTSWDHTAQLWNRNGKEAHTLLHNSEVECAAFNPNSEVLVTGDDDGAVKAWHTQTGEPFLDLPGHTGRVTAIAFNPIDNERLVTASADGTARIWHSGTGELAAELAGHTGYVWHARFSPDGTMVVTASQDCTARVWETSTGKAIGIPLEHSDTVWDAAFSPDGKWVVTACGDGSARVWEARSGKQLAELREHKGDVNSAAFSPDGQFIVTAGRDHTARVWKVGDW